MSGTQSTRQVSHNSSYPTRLADRIVQNPVSCGPDWTRGEDGRSNTSWLFRHVVGEVAKQFRHDSAGALDEAWCMRSARTAIARLAHIDGVTMTESEELSEDYYHGERPECEAGTCDCLPPDAPDPDCTNPEHAEEAADGE